MAGSNDYLLIPSLSIERANNTPNRLKTEVLFCSSW
jgi:hypothetical protein